MKCYICDATLAEPIFNRETNAYEPCGTCMAVIHDTLDGYKDNPSVAEDDFNDMVIEAYTLLSAANDN